MGPTGAAQMLSAAGMARKGSASTTARKASGVPAEALNDNKPPVPPLVRGESLSSPHPYPRHMHECTHARMQAGPVDLYLSQMLDITTLTRLP